jgi:hypothetical protein
VFGAHRVGSPPATARRLLQLVIDGEAWRHTQCTLAAALGGFLVGGAIPFRLGAADA